MFGYNNRIALVDLNSGDISYVQPDDRLRDFVGGRGIGVAVMYKHGRGIDPMSEESLLYAGVGPLTGSGIPLANRLTFVFRSPLTGTIAWANTGGYAGAEMKSAGFDAIVIKGRSSRPVYLLVQDSTVSIRDSSKFWGVGAVDVVAAIRHVEGDARVLSIGPAGEKLVSFATVVNDTGRTSGVRHGVGCLMGDKKLKAIVIKGSQLKRVEIADRAGHIDHLKRLLAKIKESPLLNHQWGLLAVHGTPIATEFLGKNDAIPVRNYQSTVLENYQQVGGGNMSKTILISRLTCHACPVECRRETASTGKYGFRVEGPDYAQISSLGTNCLVLDLEAIGYMNQLCYQYGLDPIEMGNGLAILAELTERNRVGAKNGLKWGDVEEMVRLIGQTAAREGTGEQLSMGPDKFATGIGAAELSMSVKGITIQNTDPRIEPGWGLLNATETFGAADHIWVHADLINSLKGAGVPVLIGPSSSPAQIAESVKFKQDLIALLDSLQVCAFSSYAFTPQDYVDALNHVTGSKYSREDALEIGQKIFDLEVRYNRENGFSTSDDTLPERFLNEPLAEGVGRGRVCELGPMLTEYQRLRSKSPAPLKIDRLF